MTSVVDAITAWLILTNFRRADDDKQLQTLQQSQVSVLVVIPACWQIFKSDNYFCILFTKHFISQLSLSYSVL